MGFIEGFPRFYGVLIFRGFLWGLIRFDVFAMEVFKLFLVFCRVYRIHATGLIGFGG